MCDTHDLTQIHPSGHRCDGHRHDETAPDREHPDRAGERARRPSVDAYAVTPETSNGNGDTAA